MPTSSGDESGRVLWRLVLAVVAFSLFAETPLFLFPLAALLLVSRPQRVGEAVAFAVAGAASIWWLLQIGAPPQQLTRSAVLMSTAAFVAATTLWSGTFTHRALLAIAASAVAVGGWFVPFGRSWNEVHWWVEHQYNVQTGAFLAELRQMATTSAAANRLVVQVDAVLESAVRFVADYYPAILALQLLAGLALATAVYQRIASRPVGPGLGPLRHFRFSEHLGWAAAVPLILIVTSKASALKVVAGNLLLVLGMLYTFRGAAVFGFGLWLAGGAGLFTTALITFVLVFMLPVAAAGALLLGIVDAGMDLRRRWLTSAARD